MGARTEHVRGGLGARSGCRRHGGALLLVVAVALLTACTAPAPPPAPLTAQVSAPTAATTVLDADDPAALAVATSAALYATAPVVVLAAADDPGAHAAAAPVAERIGAPLLLTPTPAGADGKAPDPAAVAAEIARLGAGTVLAVGQAAADWADELAVEVVTDEAALPAVTAPSPRPSVLVLAQDAPAQVAATATARASGAQVDVVPGADPRRDPEPVARPEQVLALGAAFGTPQVLDYRLAVAATGVELPGGGQVLFPGRRMVALYGHPGAPAMGVLGEQGVAASVQRAQALAAEYDPHVDEPVVPAFELIATVADRVPGPDGDYSAESSVEDLRPWVDAARDAGVYVVLDLQPGRTDFLTQAQRYTELLAQPHVGLALDPEWRLGPQQKHLEQIGSVGVDEVNAVVTWLADLTREHALPQKVLMLHQFRLNMIVGRERLDTSRDELAVVLHADGFGTPGLKFETWNALHQDAPDGIWWGWKNFYDEDTPTFTPAQTLAIGPTPPVFVSYQ
ncbi:hypothetical protein [Pseudonocardia nigra]|uniref:hypothetical protein n=1 Tax=Pseudonocardia nigra TaxID=1921578 RepID=UPI001C5D1B1C|nr:hypothetical protein [Pseudonocardia nigra]